MLFGFIEPKHNVESYPFLPHLNISWVQNSSHIAKITTIKTFYYNAETIELGN